jgi:hypothetical protein
MVLPQRRAGAAPPKFKLGIPAAPPQCPPFFGLHFFLPDDARCLSPVVAPVFTDLSEDALRDFKGEADSSRQLEQLWLKEVSGGTPAGQYCVTCSNGTLRYDKKAPLTNEPSSPTSSPTSEVKFECRVSAALNNLQASNQFTNSSFLLDLEQGRQGTVRTGHGGADNAINKYYSVPLDQRTPGMRLAAWNELCVCSEERRDNPNRNSRDSHILTFIGSMFSKAEISGRLEQVVVLQTRQEGEHLLKLAARLQKLLLNQTAEVSVPRFRQSSRCSSQPPEGSSAVATPNKAFPPLLSPAAIWPFSPVMYGGYSWNDFNRSLSHNADLVWQVPAEQSPHSRDRRPSGGQSSPDWDCDSARSFDTIGNGARSDVDSGKLLPPFPERIVALIARDALCGLRHLAQKHSRVHGDVKPKNIVASPNRLCFKLCDFGSSNFFKLESATAGIESGIVHPTIFSASHHLLTTGAYKAPERFLSADAAISCAAKADICYGPPADVFALGLSLQELLNGHPPRRTDVGFSADLPAFVSSYMRDLIVSMLRPQPSDRPRIEDLINKIEETWNLKETTVRRDLFQAFYRALNERRQCKPTEPNQVKTMNKSASSCSVENLATVTKPHNGKNKRFHRATLTAPRRQ